VCSDARRRACRLRDDARGTCTRVSRCIAKYLSSPVRVDDEVRVAGSRRACTTRLYHYAWRRTRISHVMSTLRAYFVRRRRDARRCVVRVARARATRRARRATEEMLDLCARMGFHCSQRRVAECHVRRARRNAQPPRAIKIVDDIAQRSRAKRDHEQHVQTDRGGHVHSARVPTVSADLVRVDIDTI